MLFDNLLTHINQVCRILHNHMLPLLRYRSVTLKAEVALRFDTRYRLVPLVLDFRVKIFFSKERSRFDLEII